MEEEKNEEMTEETNDESVEETEDNREEETSDEIRDEVYVNDDEIEMLRSLEKKFSALEEKMDNVLSMVVDSGAIIQDSVDDISDKERENYEEDFIDIDDLDLKL